MGRYQRKDHLYQRAKDEGYASRAVYKLEELQKRFQLLKKGMSVLDLGCAPGGWMEIASELVGSKGRVLGIDLKQVNIKSKSDTSHAVIEFIRSDVFAPEIMDVIRKKHPDLFDIVLSDLSPNLSGIKFRDIAASAEMGRKVIELSTEILRPGASLVAKLFPGEDTDEVVTEVEQSFRSIKRVVLSSTRKSSNEYYLICRNFRR